MANVKWHQIRRMLKRTKNKGDFIWANTSKSQVKFVENDNGKFTIGCDPFLIPNLWQRFWMKFGLYSKYQSNSGIVRLNEDGTMFNVK